MCGIVGLFFKRGAMTASLGPLLAGMLSQMDERGPDSTGFALYGEDAPQGAFKATLRAPDDAYDWTAFEGELGAVFPLPCPARYYASHAVFTIGGDPEPVFAFLARHHPELGIFGFGERIEVFKGCRPAGCSRPTLRSRASRGYACARPYPDGDGKCGDDRALPSVRDRPRPLPRP
jgi:hypothetical protein